MPIEEFEPIPPERVKVGVPGLDKMLGGGLTSSTSTLLIGNPGTGKTLLGLHFLNEGVANDEDGLMVSFQETESQIRDKARAFGFDFDAAIANNKLDILRRSPSELDVDELAQALRSELLRRPVRRIVFNSVDVLERALEVGWTHRRLPGGIDRTSSRPTRHKSIHRRAWSVDDTRPRCDSGHTDDAPRKRDLFAKCRHRRALATYRFNTYDAL